MVKSSFTLERVAGVKDRGPVPRLDSRKPNGLNLPEPEYHALGTADMEYDTKALVWVRKPRPPLEGPRAPAVAPIPARGAGTVYEVKARGQRFWTISAHTTEEAWEQVEELCAASGYDASQVVLELHKPAREAGPAVASRGISAAEVRKRLLGSRA